VIFPSVASRVRYGAVVALVHLGTGLYTLGVVYLFASDRLLLSQAATMLAGPLVVLVALLRPEWLILILVALPPAVTAGVAPIQMIALMAAPLFGFLVQDGIHLGFRTGCYALFGIISLALVHSTALSAEAAYLADNALAYIIYYTLTMLVAFHAVHAGRLSIDRFLNALLFGIAAATAFELAQGAFDFWRTSYTYLAAMGFGVTCVRFWLRRTANRHTSTMDAVLMAVFLFLTLISFVRVAWIASLLVIVLVSRWTRRKAFWTVLTLLLVLGLTIPTVREEILPGGSTEFSNPDILSYVTTGRSALWGELWERGSAAAPGGQGWGYMWSLTSEELFDVEGVFTSEDNPFIYVHNDFLYLFVELGIAGVALLLLFWLQLVWNVVRLSRKGDEPARYGVRVLVPIVIVMFFVQLFDNGFALKFVAERFFAAAGLILGLASLPSRRLSIDGEELEPAIAST
jgi:O-antigen ligase